MFWPQIGTKVNGSHHGDNPLLKPTGIQNTTKPLLDPTTREHRKLIGAKTVSLGTNYISFFYCLACCQYCNLQRKLSHVLPIQQQKYAVNKIDSKCFRAFGRLHEQRSCATLKEK